MVICSYSSTALCRQTRNA